MDKKILVVDDERNIRLTVAMALEGEGLAVAEAAGGAEALEKLAGERFDLLLLDLKMPGIDGMEVLQRLMTGPGFDHRPRVMIITAHGTVANAVETMKLGAIDFIQKPFTPEQLRRRVEEILAREELDETAAESSYESSLQLAKRLASEQRLPAAIERAKKAIGLDPGRPEGFNLLGALYEIDDRHGEAMKQYRVALDLDPTYEPARENLQREWQLRGNPRLG